MLSDAYAILLDFMRWLEPRLHPVTGQLAAITDWASKLAGAIVRVAALLHVAGTYETGYAQPTTTAVRTDTAKLIRYENHPEWTELFDLKADPYELHNLFDDATAKDLRDKMQAEYDAQTKAIDFKIPADADQPKAGVKDHF